jgi:hypothetical protein
MWRTLACLVWLAAAARAIQFLGPTRSGFMQNNVYNSYYSVDARVTEGDVGVPFSYTVRFGWFQ